VAEVQKKKQTRQQPSSFKDLAVDEADVNLDPDEEAETVVLRVVTSTSVPLAAFCSAIAFHILL